MSAIAAVKFVLIRQFVPTPREAIIVIADPIITVILIRKVDTISSYRILANRSCLRRKNFLNAL